MESRGICGVGLEKGRQESLPVSSCGALWRGRESLGSQGSSSRRGAPIGRKVIEGCGGGSLVDCLGPWLWNMAGSFQQKSGSPFPRGHGTFFLLPGHFQTTICAIYGSVISRGFLCEGCSCFVCSSRTYLSPYSALYGPWGTLWLRESQTPVV